MPIRQMAIAAALLPGSALCRFRTPRLNIIRLVRHFHCSGRSVRRGAVVGTAATIVTAPFWALTGTPPYYYGYYGQPYFPPSAYNAPRYYPPPAPAYSPAPSHTPQPTYTPRTGRSGGNIARQLNQQELNRLEAAPVNPPPPPYYPPPLRH